MTALLSFFQPVKTDHAGFFLRFSRRGQRKNKTQISRKMRHKQPFGLNMACFFVFQSRMTDAHFVSFG